MTGTWVKRAFLIVSLGLMAEGGFSKTEAKAYKSEVYAKGFDKPWGMAFLPDGRLLITEKAGQLSIVPKNGGKGTKIKGLPAVDPAGQGGLLDVQVGPTFAKDQMIYWSFSEPDKQGNSGTAVGRAKLVGNSLKDVSIIWRQLPKVKSGYHFGSRLVFDNDGYLFITVGDRYFKMQEAQTTDNHSGKIIRIFPDGRIPKDNPFYKSKTAKKDIWSYGHRNVQGAIIDRKSNQLWAHEHGAQGGDEINKIQPGKNYGWPIITHGKDYSGAKIGIGTKKAGMEQPFHHWTPSIAPCGMMLYSGKMFAEWRGNLFVPSLKFGYLNRITWDKTKVQSEEKLLTEFGARIRDVEEGPDGSIFVIFDKPGSEVIRLFRQKTS
ncbi:MAG: PQQ-dependent sugar dehydrogenase [Pseudobacteriovorax sp.]|nr:PQQ-dependent sugar dehydrogenase [Pseudobacteriovorax sp.]